MVWCWNYRKAISLAIPNRVSLHLIFWQVKECHAPEIAWKTFLETLVENSPNFQTSRMWHHYGNFTGKLQLVSRTNEILSKLLKVTNISKAVGIDKLSERFVKDWDSVIANVVKYGTYQLEFLLNRADLQNRNHLTKIS